MVVIFSPNRYMAGQARRGTFARLRDRHGETGPRACCLGVDFDYRRCPWPRLSDKASDAAPDFREDSRRNISYKAWRHDCRTETRVIGRHSSGLMGKGRISPGGAQRRTYRRLRGPGTFRAGASWCYSVRCGLPAAPHSSIARIDAISDFVTALVSRCNNDKRLKNDVKCRSRSR